MLLLLSLLSPFIGEMVSGSSPPLEYFNPIGFLILWGFYGGGVIIMRELVVKWGGDYNRLMLLGLTYGIIEEGLVVKTFFDPEWVDLGSLAVYGRYLGVNLVWAVWLSIFHSVFSITIPILLIHSLYPNFKNECFLSRSGLKKVILIFLLTSVFIFFLLNPYDPPLLQYALTGLVTFLLIKKAKDGITIRIWTPNFLRNHQVFSGACFTLTMFVLFFIMPEINVPWIVPCVIAVFTIVILYQLMYGYSRQHIMALIIGLLLPFLLFFDIILEINGVLGMSAVGILTFILLLWKYRKMS